MQYKSPRARPPHQVAFEALPPQLQQEMRAGGFSPLRIEASGALCVGMQNCLSVSAKRACIAALKSSARDYGLSLERVGFTQAVAKAVDDGFVLTSQQIEGRRPRLFNEDGTVSQEVLQEVRSRRDTTTTQAAACRERP